MVSSLRKMRRIERGHVEVMALSLLDVYMHKDFRSYHRLANHHKKQPYVHVQVYWCLFMFCIWSIKHMAAISELDLNDLFSSIRSNINPISSIKTLLRWGDSRGTSSVTLKGRHSLEMLKSLCWTRFAFPMLVLPRQQNNSVKVWLVLCLFVFWKGWLYYTRLRPH